MCYIIGGPTASGKSNLALWLAQHVDGEIVNADSLQLYKDIPILSAAPSSQEVAQTRHHLFGIYHHDQVSTVQSWLQLALKTIETIKLNQKTPIIVGGTGMYLNALVNGISPIPSISKEIQDSVRKLQKNVSKKDFYNEVIKHDQDITNHLHPNDTQRLGRALEVFLQTGKSIKHFQGQSAPLIKHHQFILVMPDKEKLYDLINSRVLRMIDKGAIQEVQALRQSVALDSPVCKAIGVREIWQYLCGEITKDEMISLIQLATRQYAKRQITWFKNQVNDPIVIKDPFDPKQINQLVQRKSARPSLAQAAS